MAGEIFKAQLPVSKCLQQLLALFPTACPASPYHTITVPGCAVADQASNTNSITKVPKVPKNEQTTESWRTTHL